MTRSGRRVAKIHRAHLGELAPDDAVADGRVEIVLLDDSGHRESYGRLVERRRVGEYLVQLTDDVPRGMRWIVATRVATSADPPRQMISGLPRRRSADAVRLFRRLTESDMEHDPDRTSRTTRAGPQDPRILLGVLGVAAASARYHATTKSRLAALVIPVYSHRRAVSASNTRDSS